MAINPLPFIASIPDPGQAFLQSFNAARQQRAQQDQMLAQQQAQQARQQQYAQWVQRLRTDRSPQAMSEFMLQFPEQADAIKNAFEPIQEAEKQGQIGFYGSVLSALDRGDKAFAKQQAEQMLAAAKNTTGKEQFAKELEYGIELLDSNPDALRDSLASTVFTLDPERYKSLYATKSDATSFQKDYDFLKNKFGPQAANEYAQFGRGSIVEIDLPGGRRYVGPPALAPEEAGIRLWSETGQAPQGVTVKAAGPEQILQNAESKKSITKDEANVVKQSLGPNGGKAFDTWIKDNGIKVILRTGTAPDGRRVVQYQDGTVEYGAD